jgi:FAD:protein FMN transferase
LKFQTPVSGAARGVALAVNAMGTRFELVLLGEDERELRAVGEEAIREIEEWHWRLSRFEPGSDAVRLSRDADARVDGRMRELLEVCERVREGSGGAFDVRCGPGGSFDFGAVGKGWALDRAAEVVREHGVGCALLHGGTSSVIAIGAPEGQEGWKVAIRSDGEAREVVLRDRAMGVSAPKGFRGAGAVARPHRLPVQSDGRTGGTALGGTTESHIVDPRTGRAAVGVDTAAVIVPLGVEHAGALCDAWSTALVVLGARAEGMGEEFESHIHTHSGGWASHRPATMDAA